MGTVLFGGESCRISGGIIENNSQNSSTLVVNKGTAAIMGGTVWNLFGDPGNPGPAIRRGLGADPDVNLTVEDWDNIVGSVIGGTEVFTLEPDPDACLPTDSDSFPDEIFRQYVAEKLDLDQDGCLSTEEW